MHLVIEQFGVERVPLWLMVHGGAWNIPDAEVKAHKDGMQEALSVGKRSLTEGNSAVDIAALVVENMEAAGVFDAGCGAVLNREGEVELDAGIMCGKTKKWGAVAGIRHFQNPVQIARRIAATGEMQYCFLAAEHAEQFAKAQHFEEVHNTSLICDRERNRYEELLARSEGFHTSHPFLGDTPRGTVGCIVRDKSGRLAAATSTGGTPFRVAGRIGDSPLPGCGYFASEAGTASATGWGEAIASTALCREAVCYLECGFSVFEAVEKALVNMQSSVRNSRGDGATGGIILMNQRGEAAWGFSTPRMARGYVADDDQCLIKVN